MAMTRIREHLQKGVALALVALAIQLAAGLVHAHHDEAREAIAAAHSEPQQAPNEQPGDPHAGEDCALCAVLSLAASSVLPEAPRLVLPAIVRADLRPAVSGRIEGKSAALFHARAPPQG